MNTGRSISFRENAARAIRPAVKVMPASEALNIPVLENCVGLSHYSGPYAGSPIMSLRGAERRSNLCFGRLEIASGLALAMTVSEPFPVTKTDIAFENS